MVNNIVIIAIYKNKLFSIGEKQQTTKQTLLELTCSLSFK